MPKRCLQDFQTHVDKVLFNTDHSGMDSQAKHAAQLAEMNQAVRLLWRHGCSLQDLGANVIVDVPMARTVGSQFEAYRSTPVAICSYADARRLVDERN